MPRTLDDTRRELDALRREVFLDEEGTRARPGNEFRARALRLAVKTAGARGLLEDGATGQDRARALDTLGWVVVELLKLAESGASPARKPT